MTRLARWAAALAALAASGCFAPDSFDMRVSLRAEGRVQVIYVGRLTHLPSAMEAAAGRPADGVTDRIAAQMRRDPKMRSVESLGDGVYAIDYIATTQLAVGEALVFPPVGDAWLTVSRDAADVMRISARGFTPDEARALRTLGVGLNGDLTVDAAATPEAHNAKPDGGLLVWRLAGPETAAPAATFRFN